MNDAERFINYLSVVKDMQHGGSMHDVSEAAKEVGCCGSGSFPNLGEMDIENLIVVFHDDSAVFYIAQIPGDCKGMIQSILPPTMASAAMKIFSNDDAQEMVKEEIERFGTKYFLDAVHAASEMVRAEAQGEPSPTPSREKPGLAEAED